MVHFMNYKNAKVQKIDVSGRIDVNKRSESKNVNFVNIGFLKILALNLKKCL